MNIGIIRTGSPPAELDVQSYPAMIRAALGSGHGYIEIDAAEPLGPHAVADAYVITGSACGVNDRDAWIHRLEEWLRNLPRSTPIVGICFGHQLMAKAYGGAVETSPRGWGLGLHRYDVRHREAWMDAGDEIVLPVSHRDQVSRLPKGARVMAASEFCPFAALSYEDRNAISFQAHPEFPLEYTAQLIEFRQRREMIDLSTADRARRSLSLVDDRRRVAGWIQRFLARPWSA